MGLRLPDGQYVRIVEVRLNVNEPGRSRIVFARYRDQDTRVAMRGELVSQFDAAVLDSVEVGGIVPELARKGTTTKDRFGNIMECAYEALKAAPEAQLADARNVLTDPVREVSETVSATDE